MRRSREEAIYKILVEGTREHAKRYGFKRAVIGLSGGIDSSLVACIAHDALGKADVIGVSMPSKYSTAHSKEDAHALAKSLGIRFVVHPIEPIVELNRRMYKKLFGSYRDKATDQLIQSWERSKILMEMASEHEAFVMLPGNKSDFAIGHHRDIIGGLAALAEVTKTEVYRLAKHRNALRRVIPERVFHKHPSDELAPGQKDSDELPPFHILDSILLLHKKRKDIKLIVAEGHDRKVVKRVVEMIRRNEPKASRLSIRGKR